MTDDTSPSTPDNPPLANDSASPGDTASAQLPSDPAASGIADGTGENAADAQLLERRVSELEGVLDHRERQIHAMQRTAESLLLQSTPEAMVRETLTLAIQVLNAEAGSLLLHNPVTDTLVFRHVIGSSSETLTGFAMPATQGIAGRVFGSGVADITHKAEERAEFNPEVDQKTGFHTESMLTVPVKRANGAPIGVMQILNGDGLFDERDLEVLQVMSAQASAAIENSRLVQEARKAEIVNLIGDISHDIKNMLTPIQSGVWTLEPMLQEMFQALDDVGRACPAPEWGQRVQQAAAIARDDYGWILQAALDAAEKVQQRTKEIADAVKGESSPPFFELSDLNDTVREVARSLQLVVLDAHLDLILELDAELPHAEFDRKQMYYALYNLVNNAIPETPAGGSITIATTRPPDDDGALLLQIRDTGKGMPEHVRIRLFTDETVSTKAGGTGLGTRIVGGVVRRHNGKITVDSEANRGTTFTIRFPVRHETLNI